MKRRPCSYLLSFTLCSLLIFSCGARKDTKFIEVSSQSGLVFNNLLTESDSINAYEFLYMYNGSGVGISDLNNDGLTDIVLGGNMVPSRIFKNNGAFQFEEISGQSGFDSKGWVHGVSIVDINHDGLDDIYLSIGGKSPSIATSNQLFINQGNFKFTEMASSYGLASTALTTQTVFFDADNDNDLDAYLLNYENNPNKDPNQIVPKKYNGKSISQDRLLINEGGVFEDRSLALGINQEGYGLGVHVSDFNHDGFLDIYVSNDFAFDDHLYINKEGNGFEDQLKDYFQHTSNFGMGLDMADLNNDLLLDLVQVDMLPEDNRRQKKLLSGMNYDRHQLSLRFGYTPQYMRNSLQLSTGYGSFKEVGDFSGISTTDWSWSPLIADFDNDGHKDVFITNGYVKDVTDVDFRDYIIEMNRSSNASFDPGVVKKALEELKGEPTSNYMFRNDGDLRFEPSSIDWGLDQKSYSTGSAFADLDNDGDLDLIVNNLNSNAFLYENRTNAESSTSNYLQVSVQSKSLSDIVGLRLQIFHQQGNQVLEYNPNRGFQSYSDRILHFGLGAVNQIDSVQVIWRNNDMATLPGLEINRRHVLDVDQLKRQSRVDHVSSDMRNWSIEHSDINLVEKHQESSYIDFKFEPLIPERFSTRGPVSATGDLNGDGLMDIYMGGAFGSNSKLFLQQKEGFKEVQLPSTLRSEATGVALFDFNQDGHLDIYEARGSNEFLPNEAALADAIFINDGKGSFVDRTQALFYDMKNQNTGTVLVFDADLDGDLDVFAGGNVIPKNYPLAEEGQLFINEQGKFEDRIATVAPGLNGIGMVTDALLHDIDLDGLDEFIVIGKFMGVEVFEVTNNGLQKAELPSLEGLSGWWTSLEKIDIDNDGKEELFLGNLGLNSRYRASDKRTVAVYADDFDNNGSIDPIMTFTQQGAEYPFPDRAQITAQLPLLKKKFSQNIDYAEATIQDIFSPTKLSEAYARKSNWTASTLLKNDGLDVVQVELPKEVQYSQVNDIETYDLNGDGFQDIILACNSFDLEVFTGNLDAHTILFLLNDGDNNFQAIDANDFGVDLKGVAKHVELLKVNDKPHLIVFKNNEKSEAFELKMRNP